ncbi:MAG: sensor histidine kinase [Burkholderiaceae bacterium]|nr:sensor histidine kinase [Burkholderiaceae bacterium]
MSSPTLSLRRQLLLSLLLPQLVLWLVGGLLAYRVALNYAEKGIDQSLMQSVRSLARQVKPIGSGLLVDFPRAAQDILEQDPQDRVSYMVSSPPGSFLLGNVGGGVNAGAGGRGQNGRSGETSLPPPPASVPIVAGEPVLYDAQLNGQPVRVVSLEVNYGETDAPQRLRVQVAKSLAVQQRLARELVADMLVPLLLLGTVLSVLVYAGIKRGLRPLARLEAQLSDRSVAALSPIVMTEAPREVYSLAGAVNQLLETVRRSLSQEKRFLNDAAHQLRTPLAGLISQTELALQERDPKALQERLLKVLAGAQRSAHLVHQLLSLARSEADISLAVVDLAALARDVAREWTPRAVAVGVDLGFEGLDRLMVRGERILLREALSNLIDNALRYSVEGSPAVDDAQHDAVRVTLRVYHDLNTERDVVELEDNGPGMSELELPHAFERFWRASELPGGCGLGLAIVREIARQHGGTVQAEAVQPHGLKIRISLPSLPTAAD